MNQIKAIITDVDGVMIGKQEGVNFPLPHVDVLHALEQVASQGIPIVLCTAKFSSAVKQIAVQAKLHNPHITDGGAVIIDWVDDKIVSQHVIKKEVALAYVQSCVERDIYTEVYTVEDYYIQSSQRSDFTEKRVKVIQTQPRIVDLLEKVVNEHDIIKIISFSDGKNEPKMQSNVERFNNKVNYIWSQHPFLNPRKAMVITAPGVSKQHAAQEVANYLNVPPESILGIGDSEADWDFMQLCGFVATIGRDGGKLQEFSKAKGEGHYCFANSVDDHGFIEVLRYFRVHML